MVDQATEGTQGVGVRAAPSDCRSSSGMVSDEIYPSERYFIIVLYPNRVPPHNAVVHVRDLLARRLRSAHGRLHILDDQHGSTIAASPSPLAPGAAHAKTCSTCARFRGERRAQRDNEVERRSRPGVGGRRAWGRCGAPQEHGKDIAQPGGVRGLVHDVRAEHDVEGCLQRGRALRVRRAGEHGPVERRGGDNRQGQCGRGGIVRAHAPREVGEHTRVVVPKR